MVNLIAVQLIVLKDPTRGRRIHATRYMARLALAFGAFATARIINSDVVLALAWPVFCTVDKPHLLH